MTSQLRDPIGVARSGDMFLVAQRADIKAGNINGDAQIHNLEAKPPTLSDIQPLQVFFKWGNFEECTDAEYREALR